MMHRSFTSSRARQAGFSILEMLLATVILLVGLIAVAQLVPASILLNYRNRTDSSALVFAQRQLDQMLDQPLTVNSFTDVLGNTCQLGDPAATNSVQGSTVTTYNNQPIIAFNAPTLPWLPRLVTASLTRTRTIPAARPMTCAGRWSSPEAGVQLPRHDLSLASGKWAAMAISNPLRLIRWWKNEFRPKR